MGRAVSADGEKMAVTLSTVDPEASKFIKVDTSQNILYVVSERIGLAQIGRYQVTVIANYYDSKKKQDVIFRKIIFVTILPPANQYDVNDFVDKYRIPDDALLNANGNIVEF